MPKFTLPIEKIDLEDKDVIGKNFSNFYFLRNNLGARSQNSFFVTNLGFQETLSSHWNGLKNLLSDNLTSEELLENSKKMLSNKLQLNHELKAEISYKARSLKKPLLVAANLIYPSKEQETETFTAVVNNEKELLESIPPAYLSFLQTEFTKGFANSNELENSAIVLMISEKIFPEVSGNAFVNFLDKSKIRVKSGWGEYHKDFAKDVSVINKNDLSEASYFISRQKEQIAYIKGSYEKLEVSPKFQNQRKLPLEQAQIIAKLLKKIEAQTLNDISLSFEMVKSKLIITRIELNSTTAKLFKEAASSVLNLPLISSLKPIFPGLATGVGKLISKKSDLKKLRAGDIAIVDSVGKESLPFLKKASGIIINTSQNLKQTQESFVRKLGISVTAGKFTNLPNKLLTLDGRSGKVYQGAFSPTKTTTISPRTESKETKNPKTATKIFATFPYSDSRVNLDLGEADGVGPVDLKNFSIRTRPEAFKFLTQICQQANGKTVLLNLSKNHPNPDEFVLAQANLVREIRNKSAFRNLSVCIPQQKSVADLISIKKLLSSAGLHRSPTLKIFLKIETAANIFSLQDLIETGIDGLIIDYWSLVNNLFQENLSYSDLVVFDNSAIFTSLESILETAKKNGQFTLVYNFPIETANKLGSKLVAFSVKALATSWQELSSLRTEVAHAEKNLIRNKN